jgi:hypothetical protein
MPESIVRTVSHLGHLNSVSTRIPNPVEAGIIRTELAQVVCGPAALVGGSIGWCKGWWQHWVVQGLVAALGRVRVGGSIGWWWQGVRVGGRVYG